MKSYKKLLLISCILCIIQLSFLPAKAEKLTGTAEEIQWEYDDETKTLTFWGKGKIPDAMDCTDWKEIEGMAWEYKRTEIEHIVLNEGITEIGELTFFSMTKLKTVKLCDSLEIIGVGAFKDAWNLESIELPENVKWIKSNAFDTCKKIQKIVIPESVEYFSEGVFLFCSDLEEVKLPSSLKKIPINAFRGCFNLKSIEIPECVTEIGEGAFMSSGIEQIVIPENALVLGKKSKYTSYCDGVFQDCINLTQIKLPSKLKEIPCRMFDGCTNLKSIEIPESVTTIGEGAFAKTGIEQITLPKNVKNLGKNDADLYYHYGAFAGCTQLTDVRLPSNLKEIPYRMFDGCTSLTTIKIPKSVTTIGEGAFARTGIKQITLPKNVTYIGKNKVDKNNHYGVFEECTSLKEIVVRSKKVKKVTKYTWNGLQKNAVIRVPKSKKKEYQKLFRKAKLSKKQKVRVKK